MNLLSSTMFSPPWHLVNQNSRIKLCTCRKFMHHLMNKRIPKEDTCLGISVIEASQPYLLIRLGLYLTNL